MDAIGAVDIGVAGPAEHHAVARRLAIEGVRSGIVAIIGLDLHDDAACTGEMETRANQFGRDGGDRTVEELARKRIGGKHGVA